MNGASEYTVKHIPGLDDRPLRVVCAGAGLSGIYLAIQLSRATKNVDLVIYEKNADVGGTWFENVYPGCACDIPAHRYCYTFEPNSSWSTFYAPAAEIQKYFAGVAHKFGCYEYIKLQHKITSAIWDENKGKWAIKIENADGDEFVDECDVYVNAMGVLNNWKWPSIPGLKSFKGPLLHSAAYDNAIDLTGKKVAVIGSGSSGIQIVPSIESRVSKVGAYLRSSTWIVPPFSAEFLEKDENGNLILEYSEKDRRAFKEHPEVLLEHRRALEREVTRGCRAFFYHVKDPSQPETRQKVENYMKGLLQKKPELAEHLIPNWPVGCRRLTPGIGFLEALCKPHVEPIFTDIASIGENGITTIDGQHRDYDVIICATGFDVSYGSRFPFKGRNGKELDQSFTENPTSYFALTTPGFPNYFTFNGANAPVGAGSLVPASEAQGDYIVKAIIKIQREGIKSMMVQDKAVEEFTKHTDTFMPSTVWSEGCRSWYKNGKIDGRVTALWPGSGLHFIRALENPRWEDYEYTYTDNGNMYSYLGDGFTPLEWEGGDRTWDLAARTARMDNHPALRSRVQAAVHKVNDTNGSRTSPTA